MSPDTIATLTIDGRTFDMSNPRDIGSTVSLLGKALRRARLVYIHHDAGDVFLSVRPDSIVSLDYVGPTGAVELPGRRR